MIWTTHETLKPSDFKLYPNAQIDYLKINENGVILYYTKNDTQFSLAGANFNAIKAQWDLGMI